MASFEYQAVNEHGHNKQGLLECDTPAAARQLLRQQGLTPLTVTVLTKVKTTQQTNHRLRLKTKDLSLFFRHLATLISASIPLADALATITEQTTKAPHKQLMSGLRSYVNEGHSLAGSMAHYPHAFGQLYRAAIDAGEQTGKLETILQFLADYSEKQEKIGQKIKQAMIYPSLMITVSILIVTFLLIYVVPKIVDVFNQTGQHLPGITLFLIHLSAGIKHYGGLIVIVIILSVILFKQGLKRAAFQKKVHQFLLRLPIIGQLIRLSETSRFERTLGILLQAGVDVITAINNASQIIRCIPIHQQLSLAAKKISEGEHMNRALKDTGYFPLMSIHLIHSGENSGQLAQMLLRAADNQDDDINQTVETGLTLFEPILILLMGSVVLFIVLAILMPIFSLDQIAGLS